MNRSPCNTTHPAPVPSRPSLANALARRRSRDRTVVECSCGAVTDKARKGECPRCALRTVRGHALGPACEVCGLAIRRMLRRITSLCDGPRTLCGNHFVLAGRRPITLAQLRQEADLVAGRAVAAA